MVFMRLWRKGVPRGALECQPGSEIDVASVAMIGNGLLDRSSTTPAHETTIATERTGSKYSFIVL